MTREQYWKKSSEEAWSRINRELRELGPLRTEITLVDIDGNPGERIFWLYRYERYGKGECGEGEKVYGYITDKCHGTPLAHVIRDINHEEFLELVGLLKEGRKCSV